MEEKRSRILIIDDEPENVRLLEVKLRQEYEVETAKDGFQALAYLKKTENKPDLILLDQMMPYMDGLMTFTAMRQRKLIEGVPVIMVTAYGEVHSHSERLATLFRQMGGADFIEKPIDTDVLIQKISEALSHRQSSANG